MKKILVLLSLIGAVAWAQEEQTPTMPMNDSPGMAEPAAESPVNRDPAQDSVPGRKTSDEELRVLTQLPDAQVRKDSRSLQSEVYKTIYNRELKPDQREDVLDE